MAMSSADRILLPQAGATPEKKPSQAGRTEGATEPFGSAMARERSRHTAEPDKSSASSAPADKTAKNGAVERPPAGQSDLRNDSSSKKAVEHNPTQNAEDPGATSNVAGQVDASNPAGADQSDETAALPLAQPVAAVPTQSATQVISALTGTKGNLASGLAAGNGLGDRGLSPLEGAAVSVVPGLSSEMGTQSVVSKELPDIAAVHVSSLAAAAPAETAVAMAHTQSAPAAGATPGQLLGNRLQQGPVRASESLTQQPLTSAAPTAGEGTENLLGQAATGKMAAESLSPDQALSAGRQPFKGMLMTDQGTAGQRGPLAERLANLKGLFSEQGGQTAQPVTDSAGRDSQTFTSLLSASQQQTAMPVNTEGRVSLPATITFGQPQWAGMVAERAASMALQNIQFAELQLDPAELGPVQIKVSVQNDQASVVFNAAHSQVRDALDQTANRLRDLLAAEGLDLVDVDVSDHPDYQQGEDGEEMAGEAGSGSPVSRDAEDDEAADSQTTVQVETSWGVDSYA